MLTPSAPNNSKRAKTKHHLKTSDKITTTSRALKSPKYSRKTKQPFQAKHPKSKLQSTITSHLPQPPIQPLPVLTQSNSNGPSRSTFTVPPPSMIGVQTKNQPIIHFAARKNAMLPAQINANSHHSSNSKFYRYSSSLAIQNQLHSLNNPTIHNKTKSDVPLQ